MKNEASDPFRRPNTILTIISAVRVAVKQEQHSHSTVDPSMIVNPTSTHRCRRNAPKLSLFQQFSCCLCRRTGLKDVRLYLFETLTRRIINPLHSYFGVRSLSKVKVRDTLLLRFGMQPVGSRQEPSQQLASKGQRILVCLDMRFTWFGPLQLI